MTPRLLLLVALAVAPACGNLQATRPAPCAPRPVAEAAAAPPGALAAWWIGHASVLLRLGDRWVLTDPVFGARVGGLVKRYVAAAIGPAALPPIDAVVVSHAHFDHLDPASLERVRGAGTLAVPPGMIPFLPRGLPFAEIAALDRWQTIERDGLRLTAVPARHADGRYGFDALWSRRSHTGWVVEAGGWTVYFAGDTGYDDEIFKEIGRRFRIDLALIPVGPAGRSRLVHRLRRHVHVDPAEALQIFEDVGARWMIPIHHGTFFKGGAAELRAIVSAIAADEQAPRVRLLAVGEALVLERPAATPLRPALARRRCAPPDRRVAAAAAYSP